MKEKLPACPKCTHPVHMHTREGCWWMKYVAGEWPCRCDLLLSIARSAR